MPKWVLKAKVKKILDEKLMSKEEREAFRAKEKDQALKNKKLKNKKSRTYLIERARQGEAAGPGPKPFKTKQK